MKETTVVWAKLFLILIISAKPLGLEAFAECKRLGNNSCINDSECCSGHCYKEPGWELGVCKKMKSREKSNELNDKSYSSEQGTGGNNVVDDVFEAGSCGFYEGEGTTANGDIFNENEMTAAHRTLQFNTMVRVETMGTNVVVRINDRKTSSDGQILLLSRAAASYIMDIGDSSASVRCQLKVLNDMGCTPDLGNTCVMHHECCSQYCLREMYSEVGFCVSQ